MSDLAASATVTIGQGRSARDILVYELTPKQMRELLLNNPWPGPEAGQDEIWRYQIDMKLFEDCSLSDLALITRLPLASVEDIPPTQLRKIIAKAKEINPDFFSALERLADPQSKS